MKILQSFSVFCGILLLAPTSYAQITITSVDLPQAGSSYTIQESTADLTGDYVTSGADHIWDFSSLNSLSEIIQDFDFLDNAPSLPQFSFNNSWTNPDYFCDSFGPGDIDFAALGLDLPVAISNMYNYYQTNGISHNIAGISLNVEGIDMPIEYTDIDEIHPLPLTMGDVISSTSAFELDVPNTFTYSTSSSREGSVDGWGTLLLPNGATHEVLRLNTVITAHDIFTQPGSTPFELDRVSTVYQWLGNGGVPFLEVKSIFGVTYSVRYQGNAPDSTIAVTENTFSDIKPYPNPVNSGESVTLNGATGSTTWTIYDTSGRIAAKGQGSIISTENWAPGLYFIMKNISETNAGLKYSAQPITLIVQ